jgi:hypothetical protein
MSFGTKFDLLNSVKYLYLCKLSEPKDNSLRIVVEEAVDNRGGAIIPGSERPELAALRTDIFPIEPVEGCKIFELSWNRYVAYLVTEEMVGSCGNYEDEDYSGNLFRVFTKSHFLEHLTRDTGAHTEPIQHFKLACLNHLIDIASYEVPSIRLLARTDEVPPRIENTRKL